MPTYKKKKWQFHKHREEQINGAAQPAQKTSNINDKKEVAVDLVRNNTSTKKCQYFTSLLLGCFFLFWED